MEQIANELKDVFIPFSQGQRQQFIAEFESKTGISLPTDEQLEKVIDETLNADEGKWRKTIPEEIISLFEKRPDEIIDSGALFSLRKKSCSLLLRTIKIVLLFNNRKIVWFMRIENRIDLE